MLREIVKPQSEEYILHIPKEYINKRVEILVLPFDVKEEQSNKIDFSSYKIEAFKDIDPVQWQEEIRLEWERDFE